MPPVRPRLPSHWCGSTGIGGSLLKFSAGPAENAAPASGYEGVAKAQPAPGTGNVQGKVLYNNAPGTNRQADRVINTLLRNWRTYTADLASTSRPDVKAVLWTIPDITLTPRYWEQLSGQQRRATFSYSML